MKDYQKQLDKNKDFPEYIKNAEPYFEKYWLDKSELNDVWLEIKNRIFNQEFHQLPNPVINKGLNIIILKGGIVFLEKEFELFQACMKMTGDKHFIVLEDYDENNPPHLSGPPYRLKFPIDITWEQMTEGGAPKHVGFDVFMWSRRNYFVFGDSGTWGKYEATDYELPLEIIGFDKKYSGLFHDKFKIPSEDVADLKRWTASYGIKLPGYE
jgi:hypothetical protein